MISVVKKNTPRIKSEHCHASNLYKYAAITSIHLRMNIKINKHGRYL